MFNKILNNLALLLILYIIVSLILVILLVTNRKKPKYVDVINPEDKEMDEVKKLIGKSKKREGKLKKNFKDFLEEKGINEKIERMYYKAGFEKMGLDFFITQNLKYLFYGLVTSAMLQFVFQNLIITSIAFLVVVSLHVIDILATIQERKKDFVSKFPFFLKTMSFAMINSSSFSVAFRGVIDKTEDGVLKEVMEQVLEQQRLNGGDFTSAFQLLVEKIDSEETREFVETINTNATKGIPIAESFDMQADSIEVQSNNRKNKLIKNLDNKVMIPILLIIASLALLIWGVVSFGI